MNDEDDLAWGRLGLAIAACALIAGLIFSVFWITGPPLDPYLKGVGYEHAATATR